MDIQEYLSNPMGKGSSIFMIKDMQRILNEQYAQLNGKMELTWYKLEDKYYIAHVKVPSRHAENLFYDVLLEFDMESIPKTALLINKAKVRVFSNCPSFTYTYAHAFNIKGDLIPWTKSRYPADIFSKEPVKRNPYKFYSYERSLYLAIKFILSNGRNTVKQYNLIKIKTDTYQKIIAHIKKTKDIEAEYREKVSLMKKRESPEKEKPSSTKASPSKSKPKKSASKTTAKTKKVKSNSVTKKSKKVNKI